MPEIPEIGGVQANPEILAKKNIVRIAKEIQTARFFEESSSDLNFQKNEFDINTNEDTVYNLAKEEGRKFTEDFTTILGNDYDWRHVYDKREDAKQRIDYIYDTMDPGNVIRLAVNFDNKNLEARFEAEKLIKEASDDNDDKSAKLRMLYDVGVRRFSDDEKKQYDDMAEIFAIKKEINKVREFIKGQREELLPGDNEEDFISEELKTEKELIDKLKNACEKFKNKYGEKDDSVKYFKKMIKHL